MKKYNVSLYQKSKVLPVNLYEVKDFLCLKNDNEDIILNNIMHAVILQAEEYLEESFISKSYKISLNGYYDNKILLPKSPFVALEKFVVINNDNSETVKNNIKFYIENDYLFLNDLSLYNNCYFIYKAGYGASPNDIPANLRLAILYHIRDMYNAKDKNVYKIIYNCQKYYKKKILL